MRQICESTRNHRDHILLHVWGRDVRHLAAGRLAKGTSGRRDEGFGEAWYGPDRDDDGAVARAANSAAKSSFDAHNNELTQMAANIIVLDRTLTHYGPETREIRGVLRQAVIRTIGQIWPKDSEAGGGLGPGGLGTQTGGEVIYDKIQELGPRTEAQRAIQSQAESLMINLAQTRWLLFAQSARAISTPFLIVVVFWLSMLFVSFGLFAPLNATAIATLLVIAISSAGAFFLILELDRPFSGLIHISSAPLYNALALLGR